MQLFLLLRTVVPAVCNMGERVLPTMRTLSEAAKRNQKEAGIEPVNPKKQGRQGPRIMIREVWRVGEGAAHRECRCSSLRVRWWRILTINSHSVEISITRCVREMVCDPNLMPFLFYFLLYFYHGFIVVRSKKLRAAPAMEKTKPINQNQQQKEPLSAVPPRRVKVLRPKPLAYRSESETKYKEITTLNLLLIYPFFVRKDIRRENKTTNHHDEGNNQNLRGGTVFPSTGWGGWRGGGCGGGACPGGSPSLSQ